MVCVSYERTFAVVLAVILIAGLASPAGATSLPTEQDTPESSVAVQINCQDETVQVTAPETTEYRVQVAVVNVTSTSTSTARTSTGPYSGNATVTFDGAGLVHAFVTTSTDRVVASTVADCSGPAETTTASDVESVVVDCNESTVRVVASPDVQYDARLTVARVSPTQQAITTVGTGPHTGNSTIQFGQIVNATTSQTDATMLGTDGTTPQTTGTASQTNGNVTVYAFVSTEQSVLASAVTRCRTA